MSSTPMPSFRTLTTADGRALEYRVSGPDVGVPLLFHHGTPGSASPIRGIERAVHARGLRFVTYSRPGYGGSTRLPGRSVADAVEDAAAVLEGLRAEESFIAGWSGGGPHALACAARLPGVRATLVIAGVAPSDADDLDFLAGMGDDNLEEFGAAWKGESELRAYLDAARQGLVSVTPGGIVAEMGSLLPDVDRAVLSEEFGEDMAASFRDALRIGVDGWLDDDLAFVRDWGFGLDEITVPTRLWQGTADLMVPPAHGRWFETQLLDARVSILPGEGHLSLSLGHLDAMLDDLIGAR